MKLTIGQVQKKLWQECRRVADILYPPNCYTCPAKNLIGSNKQLGHVPYPKSILGAILKYDMRCLRWQCYSCNINKGGMGAVALETMTKEKGKAHIEQIKKDNQKSIKAYDHYVKLLEEYGKM